MVVAALLVLVGAGIGVTKMLSSRDASANSVSPDAAGGAPSPAKPINLTANADAKAKLQAAQEYADRKDYATAEDIFKQVLKTDPNNVEALKALASVLYREDKIEESAAILDKLPHN